jgi:hypothetical protein
MAVACGLLDSGFGGTMNPNPTPYAVQVATTASKTLRTLPEHEWVPIRHRLAHISALAAARRAPDRETLEVAGFSPPILRVQVGQWLILYEVSPADWMVTVKYILSIPAHSRSAATRRDPVEVRAGA